MKHNSFVTLPFVLERDAPPFEGNDIKYPESLVRYCLKRYAKPKSKVLDPFLGMGTTAFVSEEIGHVPYGIETDRQKYEWVAGQLEHWQNIVHGDAGKINAYGFPKFDICMTSPPYMPCHHRWNPLYNGDPKKAGYDQYLKRLGIIFANIKPLMKKNAYIIVQADNLQGRRYTPLVRDIGIAIEKSFRLEQELIVKWDNPKPDYSNTHCLIFRNL